MQDTTKLSKKYKDLLNEATNHIKKQYKKDRTSIAAALLTEKGTIHTGINIKYKSIWKCICAERIAIAKALEAGDTEFDTIVSVKYEEADKSFFVVNMCGECRQVALFHQPLIVIVNHDNVIKTVSIEAILPYPYGQK